MINFTFLLLFYIKTPIEKNARKNLDDSIAASKDPSEIRKALEVFNEKAVDDHGENSKAGKRIEYLEALQGLFENIS